MLPTFSNIRSIAPSNRSGVSISKSMICCVNVWNFWGVNLFKILLTLRSISWGSRQTQLIFTNYPESHLISIQPKLYIICFVKDLDLNWHYYFSKIKHIHCASYSVCSSTITTLPPHGHILIICQSVNFMTSTFLCCWEYKILLHYTFFRKPHISTQGSSNKKKKHTSVFCSSSERPSLATSLGRTHLFSVLLSCCR